MTVTVPPPLAGLGKLFELANTRRALLEELRAWLDELESGGRVVSGERALWQTAQQLLQGATAALQSIRDDNLAVVVEEEIDRLEREEWDLLEDLRADLKTHCDTLRGAIDKLRELATALVEPLRDLSRSIEQARVTLTPTREAHRVYASTANLLDQVKADLSRAPGAALARRSELELTRPRIESTTASLRSAIDRARLHLRHAELVLIRTQGNRWDDYLLLLRTPAEPGAHGVYVRGTSTLVAQDRAIVFEGLDELSRTLVSGARRQKPNEGAPPPVPAPPELRGGLPPLPAIATMTPDERIADLGTLIFKLFLPEPMQMFLRRTPCALTLTTNDLQMPWELMRFEASGGSDADEVLCLDRCIGRLPMGNTFPRLDRPQPLNNPRVRFLLICADDEGKLKGARDEIDRIAKALRELEKARASDPLSTSLPIDVEVLASPNVNTRTLNYKLRYESYNVIHFAGHAQFDPKQPDLSALVLDKGELFLAQKIRRLLIGRPLVFLNACDSARAPTAEASQDAQVLQSLATYLEQPAEGLAASFLYGGALGCIGSLWPVYDEPASDFAIEFYKEVLGGNVIGEAMRLARREAKRKHPQHLTWATFVLYGNPTFLLQS